MDNETKEIAKHKIKRLHIVFFACFLIVVILWGYFNLLATDWMTLIFIAPLLYLFSYFATRFGKQHSNKWAEALDIFGRVVLALILAGLLTFGLVYGLIWYYCVYNGPHPI